MHRRVIVLCVLASLLAPLAQAEPLMTDPQGDATATLAGQAAPAPLPDNPQTANADLLSLESTETLTDFVLTLQLASLASPPPRALYAIDFTWDDAAYRIAIERIAAAGGAATSRASLLLGADGDYAPVSTLSHEVDATAGTMAITLPKALIVSLEGHAPVVGESLTGIRASSLVHMGDGADAVLVQDVMPDSGAGTITLIEGGESTGHLIFEVSDPVRVSNGGATTFVFQAHLQNAHDQDDTASLAIQNLPEGWNARLQSVQQVPANGEKPITAIVSVPFAHEHGGFSGFDVVATSGLDASARASVRFGVLHTPVPMPAGHHGELYLHATQAGASPTQAATPQTPPFMNTLGDHTDDAPEATPTSMDSNGVDWRIPLGPQLAMGLDFDLNRTGTLDLSVIGRASGEATLTARLVLTRGEEETVLLAEAPPMRLALDIQEPTPASLTLTPTPESDYVPYSPGQNLELILGLEFQTAALPANQPTLPVEAFKLALPLNEYHDKPQNHDEDESTLQLVEQGPIEKTARPGTVAAYVFTLKNAGAATERIVLEAAGNDHALATIAPEGTIQLAAGETRQVTLGVAVPDGSQSGERLDVVLLARSDQDPSNLAIAHTTTLVNKGAATADERAIVEAAQNEGKDTPGPGLVALVAAVAFLAIFRRRRA